MVVRIKTFLTRRIVGVASPAMDRIRIGIITAPRTGGANTLDRTIHTMRVEDPVAIEALVGVFMDGVDAPVLEESVDHVELRTAQELAELKSLPYFGVEKNQWESATLRGRTYFGGSNLARALRWAGTDSEIAVVSEDDLLCGTMWLERSLFMLQAALEHTPRPVLCLSNGYFKTERFGQVLVETPHGTLYTWGSNTFSNGMSPMVMPSEAALALAQEIDLRFASAEPDVAVLFACRDQGVATGLFTDPCLAMHMDINSTYVDRGKNWIRATTKRFVP